MDDVREQFKAEDENIRKMTSAIIWAWLLAMLGCCCVFPGLLGLAAVIWAWK